MYHLVRSPSCRMTPSYGVPCRVASRCGWCILPSRARHLRTPSGRSGAWRCWRHRPTEGSCSGSHDRPTGAIAAPPPPSPSPQMSHYSSAGTCPCGRQTSAGMPPSPSLPTTCSRTRTADSTARGRPCPAQVRSSRRPHSRCRTATWGRVSSTTRRSWRSSRWCRRESGRLGGRHRLR